MDMWIKGRQGTGYDKLPLIVKPFGMDIDSYILRFPEGCSIPTHTDPVRAGFKHYRLNIVIKKARKGWRVYIRNNSKLP